MFHSVLSTCCWELESLLRVCTTAKDFSFTLNFVLGKADQDEILLLLFPCHYFWKSWFSVSVRTEFLWVVVFFFSWASWNWLFSGSLFLVLPFSLRVQRWADPCSNSFIVHGRSLQGVFSPAKATWLKIVCPVPCAAFWNKILIILYSHVLLFCCTEELGLNKAESLL